MADIRTALSIKIRRVILFIILAVLLNGYGHSFSATPAAAEFKIAVFKEEGFPAIGTPASLTPERIRGYLPEDFCVTYLDFNKLNDREYFNAGAFDLLILPYGEAFPYKAFASIKEYLFAGGGLLNIAGRPFWEPMEKISGKWQRANISDPYKEFASGLGIKYYEFPDNDDIGLSVTTSLGFSPVRPTHGNVFPYRIPARDFYFLESTDNRRKNSPFAVLIKSWKNPYIKDSSNVPRKWCLIGQRGENNPLNPGDPAAKQNLMQIIERISSPLVTYELLTDLAAYKQKEKVKASVKVINNGRHKENCVLDFEFLDKTGKPVYKKRRDIKLGAGKRITLSEIWHPEEFTSDFYKVRAILKKNDLILDEEENGFVVINENTLRGGPTIQIKGKEFIINGERSLILGANYYESRLGELLWLKPDMLRIREDFKSMRDLGINFVRIHYHHSKWFRDYFSQVARQDLDPYFQVADHAPLPSERSLRILDAVIQLAQEQGLIFCMDIFSLVPDEMGDPIGWLGLKERVLDKEKISVQKKFIAVLANRYKDVPGITWDLWNEPRFKDDDLGLLKDWARQMKETFRKNNDNHPITIGDDLSLYLLDVLDYACVHTYEPRDDSSMQGLGKPVIFQEVWNPAGLSREEETRQADELKKDFNAFLKTEAAGFVPWQWTMQARLWDNASDAERWDDELGLFAREDGSLKPAAHAYYLLIGSLKSGSNIIRNDTK